jgi:hypothetical protein
LYYISVTNPSPCNSPAAHGGSFEITSTSPCASKSLPTSGYCYGPSGFNVIYGQYAFACTTGASNRLISMIYSSTIKYQLGALDLSETWAPANCVAVNACDPAYTIGADSSYNPGIECDSNNMVYYVVNKGSGDYSLRYRLYKIPWNDSSSTWGAYTEISPALPTGFQIRKLTLDEMGNPIVLALNGSTKTIFHWNGAGWNTIPTTGLPTMAISNVLDLAWNPVQSNYVFITFVASSSTDYKINLYALSTSGLLNFSETDIFSFAGIYTWAAGIHIDQQSPDCRVLVYGGYTVNTGGPDIPVIRYSASYGDKKTGVVPPFGSTTTPYYPHPNSFCYNACYSNEMNRFYTPRQVSCAGYFNMPADW